MTRQVAQLRRLDSLLRWAGVALLWMTLGAWSCWEMRASIALLGEYFTFTGLRYSLFFHLWGGGGGLIFCVALTLSSLMWQVSQCLCPPSGRQWHRLEARVRHILAQGAKHPYWRWIQHQD